jgi:3-hydroxyisobutyrate dehydrogenase-like beta-hydroxyacid dehydrogenase
MASRLLAAGHDLVVTTRRQVSAELLIARGARWASSPSECARDREFIVMMLPSPSSVRDVASGPTGLFANVTPGSVVVDMSTSGLALARELAREGAVHGAETLDAPVSGGPAGAQNGTLAIMVGGAEQTFVAAGQLFKQLGEATYVGSTGAGQLAKLANQVIIGATMAGIAEAYGLVSRTGLDPRTVLGCLQGGMAASALLDFTWPRAMSRDLAPGFKVGHLLKDLRLVLEEGTEHGEASELIDLVVKKYEDVSVRFGDDVGTQALALVDVDPGEGEI